MIISLFLLTMTLCLSKVTIHSSSHNFPIEMILGVGWEIFLYVLLGLIRFLVGSGLGVWMPLWMRLGVPN